MGWEKILFQAARAAGKAARGAGKMAGKVKGKVRLPSFGEGVGTAMTMSAVPGLLGQGGEMMDDLVGTDWMGKKAGMRRLRGQITDEVLDQELDFGRQMATERHFGATIGSPSQKPLFVPSLDFEDAQQQALQQMVMREQSKLGAVASRETSVPDLNDLYIRMGIR